MGTINKIGVFATTTICIVFIGYAYDYYADSTTNPKQFVKDKYGEMLITKEGCEHSNLTEETQTGMKELFPSRLADYKEDLGKMANLQQYMMIFLVIGLLMLFYRPKVIKIPMVGLDIPDTLVFVFVIGGSLYTWANFSLLNMSTLDSRMVLESMTDKIEFSEGQQINHYYSNARVLLDQGLNDAWCTYYYDIFAGGDNPEKHKTNAAFFLFGIYTTFLGTLLGTALTLCITLVQRRGTFLSYALFSAILFSLASISYQMLQWFKYSGLFYVCIWATATVFMLVWGLFGKKIADKIEANQKKDLAQG